MPAPPAVRQPPTTTEDRTSPPARPFRLANSIRLPFWIAVAVLLLFAIVGAALLGRTSHAEPVPTTLLDYQRALTNEMAQNVRRGLNEGVADVAQMAVSLEAGGRSSSEDFAAAAEALQEVHERYGEVALVSADGEVVYGNRSSSRELSALDAATPGGIAPLDELSNPPRPLIEQYARVGSNGDLVVARYDPDFLQFALGAADPGDAWLVDRDGRILSASSGYLPFAVLPSADLRDAAAEAGRGRAGGSAPASGLQGDVIAWAPVAGEGPGGQLGMSVVARRSVGSLSLPATDARREGLVVAVLISIFTVLAFAWLWIVVLVPTLRLRDEAERVARGDFSSSVAIIRYDEIGLISRAVDRLRVLLVGARVPGAGESIPIRRRQTPLRRAAAALLVVIALGAFVALLVAITTVGGEGVSRSEDDSDAQPRSTTTTSSTPTPSTDLAVEGISCIQRGGNIEYRARISHQEPTPVFARLTATFRTADGTEIGRGEAEQEIAPGEGTSVTVSVPVSSDLRSSGATCAVASIEPLSP